MLITGKTDSRSVKIGTSNRGCERIGPSLAGKAAIILIFILSGSSTAQPRATIRPNPQTVPLNQQLHITLELAWTGEGDAYDIPQPDASALEEFRVVERSLAAERKDGKNVLKHEILLQPMKEGEYDVGRIRVEYFEKKKDVPMRISLPQTMVKVVPPQLIPGGARTAAGVGALVVTAGVAASIIFLRRTKGRRRQSNDAIPAAQRRRDELLSVLDGAVSLRIEGETGAYMDRLCALAGSEELEPHIDKLEQLRELAESVKFGELILSPDQLTWAEKKVKDAIRAAFPVDDREVE